jgi:hypothetical protein
MAVVILVVALVVAVAVASVALVRLSAATRRVAELETRVTEAEAAVAAGTERETALGERSDALAAERDEQRARADALAAEQSRLQAAVDDSSGELARLDDQLATLRDDLANAQEAAREADTAAVVAVAHADATEKQLVESRAEIEQLRSDLAAATAAPALPPGVERPEASPVLVEGLWALERTRTERTWRQSVTLDPSGPGPFQPGADPARTTVEVEAAAVREDVGSVITLDWRIEGALPAADGLLVVRSAQELLASGARLVEDGALVVERDGGDVVLSLTGPGGRALDVDDAIVRVALA